MAKTTISVALCTYNGEKDLAEQLDSILAQENPIDEIVVCDDGSTDNTQSILKDYQSRFPDIFRIFNNDKNLGYVANFEKALSLCTGDIIFLCDQDDIWYQDKVSHTLNFFKNNPEIEVTAHDLDLFGTYNENKTYWELMYFKEESQQYCQSQILKLVMIVGNPFPGMGISLRKKVLSKYLPFQKVDSRIIHDYEIVIKSLQEGKFGLIHRVLGAYRKHENQSIGFSKEKIKETDQVSKIKFQSEHFNSLIKYTKVFNLDPNISKEFQIKIKKEYREYLLQLPIFQRIITHLKIKYYYKILHF